MYACIFYTSESVGANMHELATAIHATQCVHVDDFFDSVHVV